MVLIEAYNNQGNFAMTTLSHSEIARLREEFDLAMSAFVCGNGQIQHWIAEPSAIASLMGYCFDNHHVFQAIVPKA